MTLSRGRPATPPALSPDLLTRAGEALFGMYWKQQIGDELRERGHRTTGRTVQRWALGEYPTPEYVLDMLREVAQERQRVIAQLVREMG